MGLFDRIRDALEGDSHSEDQHQSHRTLFGAVTWESIDDYYPCDYIELPIDRALRAGGDSVERYLLGAGWEKAGSRFIHPCAWSDDPRWDPDETFHLHEAINDQISDEVQEVVESVKNTDDRELVIKAAKSRYIRVIDAAAQHPMLPPRLLKEIISEQLISPSKAASAPALDDSAAVELIDVKRNDWKWHMWDSEWQGTLMGRADISWSVRRRIWDRDPGLDRLASCVSEPELQDLVLDRIESRYRADKSSLSTDSRSTLHRLAANRHLTCDAAVRLAAWRLRAVNEALLGNDSVCQRALDQIDESAGREWGEFGT